MNYYVTFFSRILIKFPFFPFVFLLIGEVYLLPFKEGISQNLLFILFLIFFLSCFCFSVLLFYILDLTATLIVENDELEERKKLKWLKKLAFFSGYWWLIFPVYLNKYRKSIVKKNIVISPIFLTQKLAFTFPDILIAISSVFFLILWIFLIFSFSLLCEDLLWIWETLYNSKIIILMGCGLIFSYFLFEILVIKDWKKREFKSDKYKKDWLILIILGWGWLYYSLLKRNNVVGMSS